MMAGVSKYNWGPGPDEAGPIAPVTLRGALRMLGTVGITVVGGTAFVGSVYGLKWFLDWLI